MSNREILYIEDNFHNRRIVRKILERQGYILHEREDGLEGYEFLKELKPEIVLLDISLPSMDGMEIARRVKADPAVQHIYLIALTASAMQGDRERFLEAGCDDYLSKPFRALDLVDLVNKYAGLVENDFPTHIPQSSEMHDIGVLAAGQKEPASENLEVEAQSSPEPEQPIEPGVDAAPPAASEGTHAAETVPQTQQPIAAETKEIAPVAKAVEPEAEEIAPVAEAVEPETKEIAPVAEAVEPETKEIAPVAEAIEPETPKPSIEVEHLDDDRLAAVEEQMEEIPSPSEEPEPEKDPERDAVEFQQTEPEPQDLPDTEDHLDVEEPQVLVDDPELAPVLDGEIRVKKNGRKGKQKSKKIEDLDAIKAGIMGAINPENLKPVDPNTHQA